MSIDLKMCEFQINGCLPNESEFDHSWLWGGLSPNSEGKNSRPVTVSQISISTLYAGDPLPSILSGAGWRSTSVTWTPSGTTAALGSLSLSMEVELVGNATFGNAPTVATNNTVTASNVVINLPPIDPETDEPIGKPTATVTATYNIIVKPVFYTLTTTASPSNRGTVARDVPAGQIPNGTTVTLTATPSAGSVFVGWSGAATGTTNPITVVMDGNKTVTAQFVAAPPAPIGWFGHIETGDDWEFPPSWTIENYIQSSRFPSSLHELTSVDNAFGKYGASGPSVLMKPLSLPREDTSRPILILNGTLDDVRDTFVYSSSLNGFINGKKVGTVVIGGVSYNYYIANIDADPAESPTWQFGWK